MAAGNQERKGLVSTILFEDIPQFTAFYQAHVLKMSKCSH